MEKNENKNFDIEQFKRSDGSYHLENEDFSEDELKSLFKAITCDDFCDDLVIVQVPDTTTPETTVDN
jgi:hypothetical protein